MNISLEENLVPAITGYTLDEIDEQNRPLLLAYCIKYFLESIYNWVKQTYGQQTYFRLKSGLIFNDDKIFIKYPELNEVFRQAYTNFLQTA